MAMTHEEKLDALLKAIAAKKSGIAKLEGKGKSARLAKLTLADLERQRDAYTDGQA